MILRLTRSVLARYGRPAMIFCASAGPMPGRESSSSVLALLISIRLPLAAEVAVVAFEAVEPALEPPLFVGAFVCAVASVTAVISTSRYRRKVIDDMLWSRLRASAFTVRL